MLHINVLRELRQRIGSVSEYEIQEPSLLVDDARIRGIQGSITLLRTDRGLLATVRVQGQLNARCSRCLTDTQADVAVKFQEEYVPMVDADTGSPVRLPPDNDETFRIDKRFDLDLREALRQYILISEPVSPLCREDCAGLCPECGADLNAGPHQCEQPPDERWSALTGLKSEIQEGN
jgi:uncharacterized protein